MNVLSELKCRVGLHKLIPRRESAGMDPATFRDSARCYQSDYCRGRTYTWEGGAA